MRACSTTRWAIFPTLLCHGNQATAHWPRIAIASSARHGNLRYKVSRTLIVNPKDVWVLNPMPDANLTLITCYPFYYVGNAPKRFVVQARKIEPPL